VQSALIYARTDFEVLQLQAVGDIAVHSIWPPWSCERGHQSWGPKEKPQLGAGASNFGMERNIYTHATCHPDL